MNFRWAQTNKILLVMLASAVTIDGVLTTLVVHQQHHQNTINGPTRHATTAPTPAFAAPQLTLTPQVVTAAPPAAALAPPIIIPPQRAPAPHKPKTWAHRQVNPAPASPPIPPPPPTNPPDPAKSDTPVKPGTPPELGP
jgi:hypothetical protein